MKRILFTVACLLVILPAAQSFAYDHTVDGFFRARFITADLAKGKDNDPDQLVDQRWRARWVMNIDEYTKVVYFGEIDVQYGDAAYANGRNQGGGASADSVNLETKQLYLEAKIPETPVVATVGIQGYADHNDISLLLGDMAGVKIAMSTGDISGNVAWFKLSEGDGGANHAIGTADSEDDSDLWAVQAQFSPSKELTLNVDGYYTKVKSTPHPAAMNVQGSREDLYYLSVAGKYVLPQATITGWAYYNFGTQRSAAANGDDIDVSALAASVNGAFSVAGVKAQVRGIFFSSDDDATDSDRSAVRIPWHDAPIVGMAVPFPNTGLMIMMPDVYGTTYHTGSGFAMIDGALSQYGLLGLTADATYVPPQMKQIWVRGAIGFFQALEDDRKAAGTKREGKNLGTEVCGRVGYKVGESGRVGVSLNAAYAMLGDFYDKSAGGDDPDDPYEVYAMVDVKF